MADVSRKAFARRAAIAAMLLALLVALGGYAGYLAPVFAQAPPVALELLAAGFSPAKHIRLRAKGPTDVLQTKIVLQPGGDTGWHTHPGPVIVVVNSGTLTEYHENGCISTYQQGSVFFESPGEAHRVVNGGSVASEAYATFLLPHGTQPLEPAADPGPAVCGTDPH